MVIIIRQAKQRRKCYYGPIFSEASLPPDLRMQVGESRLMDMRSKQLPGVLVPHAVGGRTGVAFDCVNTVRDTPTCYHTALPRWQPDESTSSDEKVVIRLADDLGDPEVMSAWADDRS